MLEQLMILTSSPNKGMLTGDPPTKITLKNANETELITVMR